MNCNLNRIDLTLRNSGMESCAIMKVDIIISIICNVVKSSFLVYLKKTQPNLLQATVFKLTGLATLVPVLKVKCGMGLGSPEWYMSYKYYIMVSTC